MHITAQAEYKTDLNYPDKNSILWIHKLIPVNNFNNLFAYVTSQTIIDIIITTREDSVNNIIHHFSNANKNLLTVELVEFNVPLDT